MAVKAIQTRYAGHHFRSRTEARWAVFLDALGVPWQYEPEGYETAAGPYLPDFRLTLDPGWWNERLWYPDPDPSDPDAATCVCNGTVVRHCPYHNPEPTPRTVFLEIKPDTGRAEAPDPRWVEMAGHAEFYVAYGLPRIEVGEQPAEFKSLVQVHADGETHGNEFFRDCPICPYVDLCYNGALLACAPPWVEDGGCHGATRCCGVVWPEAHTAPLRASSPRLVAAYTAASSARFEHGECG